MVEQAPFFYPASEIEAALGLESRALSMLDKLGLAPVAVSGGGRGRERLFDAKGLAEIAVCAGLFWAGVELVPAAKLAGAILRSFAEIYGRPPSGLYQASREFNDEVWRLRESPEWAAVADRDDDDSLLYAASRAAQKYQSGPWPFDLHFELVDRQYGFVGNPDSKLGAPSGLSGRKAHMQPELRVLNWTRGGDVSAHQIYKEFPKGWDEPGTQAHAQACQIETEFFRAYDNPRGKLSLNVSRAIRFAHDRIWEARNG
ncbi:hypothetical protein LG047_02530 [Methylocystis sp. WRRC1]|uniref:hypothetical protein n=1 Tax=Methylocystis sp. WRRC1 TaxID=1732014 RepID=UPI001D14BEA6|nr:hypothetical protein [Methylocystis sp. WRRC1]MCC3244208.1 hypothetical protein [Methylocystis sp. WRRC1]